MSEDDDHPVNLPEGLDHEKMAEVALAILSLTRHDGDRLWKGLDWDLTNLLYKKGWICEPIGKAKSVLLTDEGAARSSEFLIRHFGK